MKFFLVIGVQVLMGLILAWGIVLALKGSFWLLAAGAITYMIGLIKVGCLPPKHH